MIDWTRWIEPLPPPLPKDGGQLTSFCWTHYKIYALLVSSYRPPAFYFLENLIELELLPTYHALRPFTTCPVPSDTIPCCSTFMPFISATSCMRIVINGAQWSLQFPSLLIGFFSISFCFCSFSLSEASNFAISFSLAKWKLKHWTGLLSFQLDPTTSIGLGIIFLCNEASTMNGVFRMFRLG